MVQMGKKKCKCIVLRYTKRKYPFHTLTNISLLYSHSVSSLQTLELFENTYSLVLLFCEGQSSMLIICSFLFEILFYYQGHMKNNIYIYKIHLPIYFHNDIYIILLYYPIDWLPCKCIVLFKIGNAFENRK